VRLRAYRATPSTSGAIRLRCYVAVGDRQAPPSGRNRRGQSPTVELDPSGPLDPGWSQSQGVNHPDTSTTPFTEPEAL
jgi:hypothetical protein